MSENGFSIRRYTEEFEWALLNSFARGSLVSLYSDDTAFISDELAAECRRRLEANDLFPLLVARDGKVIGIAAFTSIDTANGAANLFASMGTHEQDRGAVAPILRWCVDFAFDVLNLHRVYGFTRTDEPYGEVLRACGFEREGTLRESHYEKGARRDRYLLSVLRAEKMVQRT